MDERVFVLSFLFDLLRKLPQVELDLVAQHDVAAIGFQSLLPKDLVVKSVFFENTPHVRQLTDETVSQQKRLCQLEHLNSARIFLDAVFFKIFRTELIESILLTLVI